MRSRRLLASPGPPRLGGGPSHMKNFGSLTDDMNSCGCSARATCRAVVPALGTPMTKKSGRPTVPPVPYPASVAGAHQHRSQFMCSVWAAQLVVEALRAVRQDDHAEVSQSTWGVRRLRDWRFAGGGELAPTVGVAERDTGAFLPVLRRRCTA